MNLNNLGIGRALLNAVVNNKPNNTKNWTKVQQEKSNEISKNPVKKNTDE